MPPKKKSSIGLIFYAVFLVFALFVALHLAVAYDVTEALVASGEVEKTLFYQTVLMDFLERITYTPFTIIINPYTKDALLYAGLTWMLIVLMIENSKRNYIHGKEFGTSRWGTLSDIRDLFAENLEKEEIRQAKKIRNKIGRWQVRRKILRECDADGQFFLKEKLEKLKAEEDARKAKKQGNKKLYNEEVKKAKAEIDKQVVLAKRQAWKPLQLKAELDERLEEIERSPIYSKHEKRVKADVARSEYEKKLASFYRGKDKIEKIKKKYKDADMLFTKAERISFYNFKLNNNTLIIGGSGSGKTRGFVMPNILQAHSSYIITDPKGEILEKAGYFLQHVKGYRIRVLNLDDKSLSDGYNPFTYIHPERPGYEERVLSLIETIIVNTEGGKEQGGSDPFWPKAERLFLQAIFFFTCSFKESERNMTTVLKLIEMLEIGEEQDTRESKLDDFARMFAQRFGEDHIGVKQYDEFRSKASGKTAKSIVISAVARLAPFRTSDVSRIFTHDNMALDRVGEEKTAIFVVVPPTDKTFNFVAGMLFTQLFQELQYCATQVHKHDGQRLPVPCRFILDEFANTCTIPNFVQILAYARSFGIGIVPILQSLEQIKFMYKEEWGVIVDNCNTLLFLGSITHGDTLKYMSDLLGKGTFDKRTTGRTRGKQGSTSQNEDVVGRELMTPAEISQMPKKNCLLVVGGRPPFYSEKYEYMEHPNYRYTSDANKAYSFHYTPQPIPEETENVPRGEDESYVIPDEVKEKMRKLPEGEAISINDNPREALIAMTSGFENLRPLSDDEMTVQDGEDVAQQAMDELDALIAEDEAQHDALFQMVIADRMKEYRKEVEKDYIQIETNPVAIATEVGRVVREGRLIPIPNEDFVVEDGEDVITTATEEFVEEIISLTNEEDEVTGVILDAEDLDPVSDTAEGMELLKDELDEMVDLLSMIDSDDDLIGGFALDDFDPPV